MNIAARLAPLALLLGACAGSGHQLVPMPVTQASVLGDRCRVYVTRQDTLPGSIRNVRVFDGEDEIGIIAEGEFLCWDRRPQQGVGRVVFEGLGPKLSAVENVFDLPREGGTTSYYSIKIVQSGHKPVVELLPVAEGKALIEARSPAGVR